MAAPANEPIVSLLNKVKAVPSAIVNADPLGTASPPCKVKVPAANVVLPL